MVQENHAENVELLTKKCSAPKVFLKSKKNYYKITAIYSFFSKVVG